MRLCCRLNTLTNMIDKVNRLPSTKQRSLAGAKMALSTIHPGPFLPCRMGALYIPMYPKIIFARFHRCRIRQTAFASQTSFYHANIQQQSREPNQNILEKFTSAIFLQNSLRDEAPCPHLTSAESRAFPFDPPFRQQNMREEKAQAISSAVGQWGRATNGFLSAGHLMILIREMIHLE